MKTTQSVTRNEVLDILETYESFLRRDWNDKGAKERWTYWKTVLAGLS